MLKRLWKTRVRLVLVLLVMIIVIALMLMAQTGVLGFTTNLWQKSKEKVDVSLTVRKTLPISEMNGLVLSIDKVVESEQNGFPVIQGKKMLVVARWNVKLGINAEEIKLRVDENSKTIQAELPAVTVNSMEQSGTPHIYSQSGSLLDNYSSQDVLDAVDAKRDEIRSEILKDKKYHDQTIESIENMLSSIINSAPGVAGNYKILYTTSE